MQGSTQKLATEAHIVKSLFLLCYFYAVNSLVTVLSIITQGNQTFRKLVAQKKSHVLKIKNV